MMKVLWALGISVVLALPFVGTDAYVLAQQENAASEPEVQWLWGEVVSVDNLKNELKVKYLDYETDTEKEILMSINEKTTFENAKSLSDIKPQDTVSIDYEVNSEGKNIVKNISVEKPEMTESSPEAVLPEENENFTNENLNKE